METIHHLRRSTTSRKKKTNGKQLTFSEAYAYAIGQCRIKPEQYWRLTEAETTAIIAGHQRLESYKSERLRNLYEVIARFAGEKRSVRYLWPLPTDHDGESQYTEEYIRQRNQKAEEIRNKLGIFKN